MIATPVWVGAEPGRRPWFHWGLLAVALVVSVFEMIFPVDLPLALLAVKGAALVVLVWLEVRRYLRPVQLTEQGEADIAVLLECSTDDIPRRDIRAALVALVDGGKHATATIGGPVVRAAVEAGEGEEGGAEHVEVEVEAEVEPLAEPDATDNEPEAESESQPVPEPAATHPVLRFSRDGAWWKQKVRVEPVASGLDTDDESDDEAFTEPVAEAV